MAKFGKKGKKEAPGITTASLPDIVFMLLCFFMVVTKMRDAELKVKISVPTATELQKLEKKSLVSHIYIGQPVPSYAEVYGSAPRVQLNDAFVYPPASLEADLREFIQNEKDKLDPRQHPAMTAALKIDGKVKMGIVTDVKRNLRKINFRKVSYLANDGSKTE
ncbi:MAG: biopolymer transporter ExbD [Saprospiraceae bacterium]|nr:biopolymer transporter ExbD [Saprospiraceae bacterium]